MIYLIATNHLQNIKDSGVITGPSLSDHEMSFCVRKINWKAPLQQKTFRNYANYNPDKFLKDLKITDFDLPSDNVNKKDVNELWQSFKDKFKFKFKFFQYFYQTSKETKGLFTEKKLTLPDFPQTGKDTAYKEIELPI